MYSSQCSQSGVDAFGDEGWGAFLFFEWGVIMVSGGRGTGMLMFQPSRKLPSSEFR